MLELFSVLTRRKSPAYPQCTLHQAARSLAERAGGPLIAARVVVTGALNQNAVAARFEDRGFKTFQPVYEREVRHARKTVRKTYPMFSRYLFAYLDDCHLRDALNVRGCVDVLRKAGSQRMAVVPDAVLASLGAPGAEEFQCGELATVLRGQWKDLSGVVDAVEKMRVTLLFSMLGTEMRLPFRAQDLTHNPTR